MKFYDLKSRSHVEISESNITKKKMERPTKSGTVQVRYALLGSHDGRTLYQFVKESVYNATKAKEV